MHPYPITIWWVILIFMQFILSSENKVLLAKSLYRGYDLYFKNVWFSYLQDVFHFDSLTLFSLGGGGGVGGKFTPCSRFFFKCLSFLTSYWLTIYDFSSFSFINKTSKSISSKMWEQVVFDVLFNFDNFA